MIEKFITNFLVGLVPSFVWDLLPYLPYVFWSVLGIVIIGAGYRIYKLGGWPALTAAVAAAGVGLGYWLGRHPSEPSFPRTEQPQPKERIRLKKTRPTIINDNTLINIFRRKK